MKVSLSMSVFDLFVHKFMFCDYVSCIRNKVFIIIINMIILLKTNKNY